MTTKKIIEEGGRRYAEFITYQPAKHAACAREWSEFLVANGAVLMRALMYRSDYAKAAFLEGVKMGRELDAATKEKCWHLSKTKAALKAEGLL